MAVVQMITSYLLWRGMDLREAKQAAVGSIDRVDLTSHANVLSWKLSGGMKRKSLVAMVVASGADLIFPDEPTTGLDPTRCSRPWPWCTTGSA